ncbi:MAG: rhodanese-like domain-containing protein [Desulfuromonadales bacterium]|jgi:hydroxyacylglutathione hydrolase|nr:rhodanese-like domain-containing protein [Desulfuromonadales bacterium]
MHAQQLARRLATGEAPAILDVRSGPEYRSGHIPQAQHAPLTRILLRLVRLPQDKQQLIVLTCEHGPRAQLVRRVLQGLGYDRLELLEGHMAGWRRAGLPVEKRAK